MRRASLAALALAGTAAGGSLTAQSLEGSLLTTTISQRLEADSNYNLDDPSPGTSYFGDTRLSFDLLNETETQVFNLGLDTGLRALWEAEEDFEFTAASPSTARLGYATEWASGLLDSNFRFRQARVDFDRLLEFDPDDPIVNPDDPQLVAEDDTTEQRYDADIALELATDSPSSYSFGLEATRFDYSDEALDRTPRTTVGGSAQWALRLTPVLSGALGGGYSYYEAQDSAETEIRESEVTAGVIYTPGDALELSAGLGYGSRVREEDQGDGERVDVQDDQGPLVRAGLTYDFNEFVLDASARYTTAAPDPRLSGDLRLTYPLNRGRIRGQLFRRYAGGSGGGEILVTGARLGLERDINTVSRFGLDFAFSNRQDEDDPDEPDITRLEASASYGYDLTANVSADIGYRYRNSDEGDANADSHAVFVVLGRTFDTPF